MTPRSLSPLRRAMLASLPALWLAACGGGGDPTGAAPGAAGTTPATGAVPVPGAGATVGNLPPMGMRVRLKADCTIRASFSAETRALLTAMKVHGMLMADNGSNGYISGAPDDRCNNRVLNRELGQVRGRDFEMVRMDGLVAG